MGVIAKGILRGCQGLFTPVSLGYPPSVFNKNSTLKERKKEIGVPLDPLFKQSTEVALFRYMFDVILVTHENMMP